MNTIRMHLMNFEILLTRCEYQKIRTRYVAIAIRNIALETLEILLRMLKNANTPNGVVIKCNATFNEFL